MAILDRVKKRTETDLDDTEIQSLIDEANQDIITRYGPHSDPANPWVVVLEGNREVVVLPRPIDVTQAIEIIEFYDSWGTGISQYTCTANDYQIRAPYNVSVRRWYGGGTLMPRRTWGDRVQITYVPVNDGDQREEVIIKLAILAIQYDAFSQQTVGDYSGQTSDYIKERERLFMTLSPQRSLGLA